MYLDHIHKTHLPIIYFMFYKISLPRYPNYIVFILYYVYIMNWQSNCFVKLIFIKPKCNIKYIFLYITYN